MANQFADFRDYIPDDFFATVAYQVFDHGWGPSDFIAITQLGDGTTESEGIGREVSRAISRSKRAQVVLTLSMTSPLNLFLSRLFETNQTFPVAFFDPNGSTNVVASKAYIVKRADASFGKDAGGTRQWTLKTGQCSTFDIGGSNEASSI